MDDLPFHEPGSEIADSYDYFHRLCGQKGEFQGVYGGIAIYEVDELERATNAG